MRIPGRLALTAALFLTACPPPTLRAQPYGLTARPSVGPFLNHALPEAAPVISGD
jgi:hypothetical protein